MCAERGLCVQQALLEPEGPDMSKGTVYCLYLCLLCLHFLALPVQAQHASLAAQAHLYKPVLVLLCHACVCLGVSHAGVV